MHRFDQLQNIFAHPINSDINECIIGDILLHDCNDKATCINSVGSYDCECNSGYNGTGRTCTGTLQYAPCIQIQYVIRYRRMLG